MEIDVRIELGRIEAFTLLNHIADWSVEKDINYSKRLITPDFDWDTLPVIFTFYSKEDLVYFILRWANTNGLQILDKS